MTSGLTSALEVC